MFENAKTGSVQSRWTRLGRLTLMGALMAFLAGCATIEATHQEVAQQSAELDRSQVTMNQQFPQPGLIRLDEPLLTATPIQVAPAQIPAQFNNRVAYSSVAPQTLTQILNTLSTMTGLTFDVRDVISDGGQAAAVALPAGMAANLAQQQLHYRFEGRLTALLDDLSQRMQASWRYDDRSRRVVFFRYESRVIPVMLPPGSKQVDASISIGGSDATGSAGGSVSITSNVEIDPWTALMNGVQVLLNQGAGASGVATESAQGGDATTMLGANGYVVANRELAQVILVARPEAAARITDFVEQTNRRFARNVLIDVRVLELQDTIQANLGASLSAVLSRTTGNSNFQINALGATLPVSAAGSSGVTISGTRGNVTIDAVVQALQSVARVSLRNQGQIVAINGQPAPFQQANQITYLQSVQTTLTPDVGSQTSLQPGTITVGFTANFIPTIMADNRIMLQYQMQSSSLLGLRSFTSGTSTIQLPELFSQSLQQQAYLNDGDVLVLFGFEQDRSQINDTQGVIAAGRSSSQNKVTTAVVIQVRAARL